MSEIVTFAGDVIDASDDGGLDERQVTEFLTLVGQRVRHARGRIGMTRRVLSERSGVSQRYLAQLETGKGNISIALLQRVAAALDFKVEWLVSGDDPLSSEIARATFLMQRATKAQRKAVFKVLEPVAFEHKKADRIALIGLRGAGKSTLGALAGEALGLPFVELKTQVEAGGGIPVDDIIALYGQEGYRLLERQAVEQIVATHEGAVLAVSGGIASQPGTFNYLLEHYTTIWLRAAPEEHMGRVRAQGDMRPMAANPNAMRELRAILRSREEQYKRADLKLNTSRKSVKESLADLLDLIGSEV